jgi:hypothetical protein
MKNIIIAAIGLLFTTACIQNKQNTLQTVSFQTVCNPLNISYMYQSDKPSYREGADPTVLLFQDKYYAFVSHSGGYFYSDDLIHWDLIVPNEVFPVQVYAPAAVVIRDTLFLIASGTPQVVKTGDPKSGIWEVANPDFKLIIGDPTFLSDDDGRLYYYAGCSDKTPIFGCELDPNTFEPISKLITLIPANKEQLGWEEKSEYNTPNHKLNPYLEGAWVNKYNGKYYLQYASPGTEYKSYNDAVYVSDKPLGPYVLAQHNPFSQKPAGFVCGAGHGSTFQDKYGNYWHIGTASLSVLHPFERRLSLFPLFFDKDDEMVASTFFGDYPFVIPDKKVNSPQELFPGWMLLSYKKKVEVSSILPTYETVQNWFGELRPYTQNNDAQNINDEEIRTWWSAASGESNEWFSLDLEELSDVYALQINFADEGTQLAGRTDGIWYRYTIEQSLDGKNWKMLVDKSQNMQDAPHDYMQLAQSIRTRYLRVKNVSVTSGNFAVSDFRVFGKSDKKTPQAVSAFTIERDADRRTVKLSWDAVHGAIGYNIRYGSRADKLYLNYKVYDTNSVAIHSLNAEQEYFFAIDAFNEGGITLGQPLPILL